MKQRAMIVVLCVSLQVQCVLFIVRMLLAVSYVSFLLGVLGVLVTFSDYCIVNASRFPPA